MKENLHLNQINLNLTQKNQTNKLEQLHIYIEYKYICTHLQILYGSSIIVSTRVSFVRRFSVQQNCICKLRLL